MQTILGSNGVIGMTLARELVKYTPKIRLVSRNPKKVNESDELFAADLSLPGAADTAVEGSEIVYLTVGLEYKFKVWEELWPVIMRSTIDACKKHKAKLVFFDNVYMYDIDAIPHMKEDSAINPPSRKGRIRAAIAKMLMDEVKDGKLTALIARSADFYGPDTEKSFVTEMVTKNFRKGKAASWFMSTEKKHSFTFAPDAAKATALLGNTPDAYNQVWHLPTDQNTLTGKEFSALFAREFNVENKISALPIWMLNVIGLFVPILREMPEMMYQYDRDYFFDSSKFEKRFNFRTTSYQEGVRITLGR